MSTTTTFTGYSDAFSGTSGNASAEEISFEKLAHMLRNLKKKTKKLKKSIKEQQRLVEEQKIAEEKRVAEAQCIAEEMRADKEAKKKKEKSFLERVGDAVVKAIPAVLVAVTSFFLKSFFSRWK